MANSGWTNDLDEIVVPPDATDDEARIYIGPNDPNALAFNQAASIVFYWGADRGFMLSVEAEPGGESGEFHLWSFDDDELKQIMDIVHDDLGPADQSSVKFGQDDSLYEFGINARQQILIEAGGEPAPSSAPVVQIGSGFDPVYAGIFPPDAQIVGGNSIPRGRKGSASSTSNTGAIGAETTVLTIPSRTYYAYRVYEMKVTGQWSMSVATVLSEWRVRKTNTAGQQLAFYGRLVGNGTNLNIGAVALSNRLFWVDGTGDVTATIVATLAAAGGTATMVGAAGLPRKIEVFDVGHINDYPDIADEPQLV